MQEIPAATMLLLQIKLEAARADSPLPNFFCYQLPLKEQLNIAILKIPRKNFLINSC